VYITADDDNLYAHNMETGKRLWKMELHDAITVSGPTLAKDEKHMFVPTMDGTVYAIDIENDEPEGKPKTPFFISNFFLYIFFYNF